MRVLLFILGILGCAFTAGGIVWTLQSLVKWFTTPRNVTMNEVMDAQELRAKLKRISEKAHRKDKVCDD